MDGPIPIVPQVLHLELPNGVNSVVCAPMASITTREFCKHTDGVERAVVLISLTGVDGKPIGAFAAMKPAAALALAEALIGAAEECDAANASPATETVQ